MTLDCFPGEMVEHRWGGARDTVDGGPFDGRLERHRHFFATGRKGCDDRDNSWGVTLWRVFSSLSA